MTRSTLVLRSLQHRLVRHLGVALAAAVTACVLTGALLVGDSMQASLHDLNAARLGRVGAVVQAGPRVFRAALAADMGKAAGTLPPAAVLRLNGAAEYQPTGTRLAHVQVLGVDENFWRLSPAQAGPPATAETHGITPAWVNDAALHRLGVRIGQTVLLTIGQWQALPLDAPLSGGATGGTTLNVRIAGVVDTAHFGRFSLEPSQVSPATFYLQRAALAQAAGALGMANLILCPAAGTDWSARLSAAWRLEDAGLGVHTVGPPAGPLWEVRSKGVFIDPALARAAVAAAPGAYEVLTYFVNDLAMGGHHTPYSFVAAGVPLPGVTIQPGQIVLNAWLARDLAARKGNKIHIAYWALSDLGRLVERRASFEVAGIVPLAGAAADRTLLPDFPGLSDVEDCRDWKPGVVIDLKRIRPKDEAYWDEYRGTPKAFLSLADGQRLWANQLGACTAVRVAAQAGRTAEDWAAAIRNRLNPRSAGLIYRSGTDLAAARGAQVDFGQLFVGFSFFLIVAALLLTGLLFGLAMDDRGEELATLRALGFGRGLVGRLVLVEGVILAGMGAIVGVVAGVGFTASILLALGTMWRAAVGETTLRLAVSWTTLLTGALATIVMAALAIALATWRRVRRGTVPGGAAARSWARCAAAPGVAPPHLGGRRSFPRLGAWAGIIACLAGAAILVFSARGQGPQEQAGVFFGVGGLLLLGLIGLTALCLTARRQNRVLTVWRIGLWSSGRRPGRSLTTISMLALGVFIIVAVGANRQTPTNAESRASGTGGFSLYAETTLPVRQAPPARPPAGDAGGATQTPAMVALRLHEGADASCLNMNQVRRPGLLGVDVGQFEWRGSFSLADGRPATKIWQKLAAGARQVDAGGRASRVIPAVGDDATVTWALGRKVGDTLDYVDARGRPFQVRIVGIMANWLFQGRLVVDEAAFLKMYPGEGDRVFLIDAPRPPLTVGKVQSQLVHHWSDLGVEVVPAAKRLGRFLAVENTYLAIFQALGALGMILGSAGLAVVVMRNLAQRRGELAVLRALGFAPGRIMGLVLAEHTLLLMLGAGIGTISGVLAALPAILGHDLGGLLGSLAITVAAIVLAGLGWTLAATKVALRAPLLQALAEP